MLEIKCPECGSRDARILGESGGDYDADYELWEVFLCDDCDCEYVVKYLPVEIKSYEDYFMQNLCNPTHTASGLFLVRYNIFQQV